MKDNPDARRSTLASFVSLALILAPWPAWAQVARVALPAASVAADAASSAAGARVLTGAALPSAPALATLSAAPLSAAPLSAAPLDGTGLRSAPALAPAVVAAPPSGARPETGNAFADEASVRGKVVVMVGTKGSRPFIMKEAARVAAELGLTLVLVDDPANRANSEGLVPDPHFIAAPIGARDGASMAAVSAAIAAHPVAAKADVVTSFMSLYAQVTSRAAHALDAEGISPDAVIAADHKPLARRLLNAADPDRAVPYAELSSEDDARRGFERVSEGGRYRVVLKTSRGENSRFLALGIDSAEGAAQAFARMDADVKAFVARPEAKATTFASHPGIMMERMIERLPGTDETSAEVVMQNGKPAFAIVSDTQGIGPKKELAGGILVFPSQQPEAAHRDIVEAAGRALNAIGIVNGSARLDLMMTKDGPRVVEINPLMGSVAIWEAVRALTGVSLVEQGLRSLLNLPVDPGHAPDGVAHYVFLAAAHTGTVESVEGLADAKSAPGVVNARSFVSPGDGIAGAGQNTYEEWAEVIGTGKDWGSAIASALAGAKRLVLTVRRSDGTLARSTGDHLQPTAADFGLEPAAPKAPGLFSKAVIGFLSTFTLVSTVVESTSLAVSQMTQPLTQGFLALAALTSLSYGAYTVGSFIGGKVIQKLGIKTSYRAVLGIRALIWTAMALLFDPATGTIALSALIPLFSLDYFFHSIGRVAEHSLQVEWFRDSEAASSRFGSFRDFIEYGSVFIGSAMALAVAKFGFAAVIYPAPIAFAVAALIALGVSLPKAAAGAKPGKWTDGFKTVFRDPGIYKPLAGYALVNSFLYMMYYIVATAFGAYAAPDPQHAAAVAGSLTAVYGVGAMLGSLVMDRMAAAIGKKAAALPEAERKPAERRLYALSAARVLPWASAALLGSWLFLFPAAVGTLVWPLFPVSLALLAIGFTAQMAINHLDVIMKSNIPKGEKDMAVGAIRTLTYLTHVAGFLLWGGLFALFGAHAFALFAAFYTLAAGAYLWLARGLKKGA